MLFETFRQTLTAYQYATLQNGGNGLQHATLLEARQVLVNLKILVSGHHLRSIKQCLDADYQLADYLGLSCSQLFGIQAITQISIRSQTQFTAPITTTRKNN